MRVLFRFIVPALLVAAVLTAASDVGARGARSAASRPNILVIMTDDQTLESVRIMQNVRRLAREGTTFDNFVVSFPLCCPSRATFLTGLYSHNTGVTGNNAANGYRRFDQSNTLPLWLQRAGYRTIMVGKYLNEYGKVSPLYVPPGWSDWHAGVRLGYFSHSTNDNGTRHVYRTRARDYQTDVYAQKALAALRHAAGSKKPFFMWLSFWAPHEGSPRDPDDPIGLKTPSPAPRHRNRFASMPLPSWPSLNEQDVSDKPLQIRRRPLLPPDRLAAVRESYQQRLESLLAVDEAVGKVVAELRRQKQLKRTLILFTSDNGYLEGQHRVPEGKHLAYEPSVRVPLIVRGPAVPRGLRLLQPAANVDLAPTIVQLARARAGLPPDGRSLVPLLRDPTLEWGRDILLEHGPGSAGGPWTYTGIRTPQYKLVEYRTGERELYDLQADPDELDNRSADPAYGTIVTDLAGRLTRLRACVASTCRRGPALSLSLAYRGTCFQSPLVAKVGGADERRTSYVEFVSGGRRFRVPQAPFQYVFPLGASASVRALAVLSDGRRMTLERAVRDCR